MITGSQICRLTSARLGPWHLRPPSRLDFRGGSGKSPSPLTYPIVVRPGPELLVGALLTALLSAAGSLLLPALLSTDKTHGVSFWVYAGLALAGLLLVSNRANST